MTKYLFILAGMVFANNIATFKIYALRPFMSVSVLVKQLC